MAIVRCIAQMMMGMTVLLGQLLQELDFLLMEKESKKILIAFVSHVVLFGHFLSFFLSFLYLSMSPVSLVFHTIVK